MDLSVVQNTLRWIVLTLDGQLRILPYCAWLYHETSVRR